MKKILQKEDSILRERAKDVPVEEIRTPKFRNIIGEMKKSLEKEADGVALAAPQIGYLWNIFIVSEKAWVKKENAEDMVFINPRITNLSKEKGLMDEGCLSCRYLYGRVSRRNKTRVRAYDEKGKIFEYGASGLLSQIFQHEMDHLNGILFIDKAIDLRQIDPKDLNLEKGNLND